MATVRGGRNRRCSVQHRVAVARLDWVEKRTMALEGDTADLTGKG